MTGIPGKGGDEQDAGLRGDVAREGTKKPRRDRCTSTNVKRAEEWKFLALQMAGRPQQE